MATFLDISALLNWNLIAQLSTVVPPPLPDGYNTYPNNYLTCNRIFCVDDNSAVILPFPNLASLAYGVADFFPFVVDGASGKFTSYAVPRSTMWGGQINHVDSYPGGQLIIRDQGQIRSSTLTFKAQFANAKLNNPNPIVLPDTSMAAVGPCGEPGPPRVYFDAIQQLISYGYYGVQGQFGGSLSGQVFRVDGLGNQTLVTSGPIGSYNSQTGQDDYDHSGASGSLQLMTNGIWAQDQGNAVGTQSVTITAGSSIACGGNNKTGIQVNPGPAGATRYPYEPGTDGFGAALVDTNIPTVMAVRTVQQGTLQFFAPGGLACIAQGASAPPVPGFGTDYQNFAVCLTRKYIFLVTVRNGTLGPMLVYVSNTPAPLLDLPSIVYRQSHFSANYARPISLTGRYKA